MAEQLSMDYRLWEQGVDRRCVKAPTSTCIYEPCTTSNDVRCCAECRACGNPCPRTRGRSE